MFVSLYLFLGILRHILFGFYVLYHLMVFGIKGAPEFV